MVKTVSIAPFLVATSLQLQDLLDSARARLADYDGNPTAPGLDSAVEVRRDRRRAAGAGEKLEQKR